MREMAPGKARHSDSEAGATDSKEQDMRTMLIAATVAAVLLAGCAPPVAKVSGGEGERPADFPDAYYRQLAERDQAVFRIDPARSLVAIEVRRGGSLAQLGHDHIVASHDVRGYIAPDEGRADLYVRLDRLVVDEPGLRAEAAFDTQPSAEAIAGTRENMLYKLGADQHPYALIAVRNVDADATGPRLNVTITVNGVARTMRIPAQVEVAGDELSVSGGVTLEQTSFGIVPFSILGGALQVQDAVPVRFRIRARRMPV